MCLHKHECAFFLNVFIPDHLLELFLCLHLVLFFKIKSSCKITQFKFEEFEDAPVSMKSKLCK